MSKYRSLTSLKISKILLCFIVLVIVLLTSLNESASGQTSKRESYDKERNLLINKVGIALPEVSTKFLKYKSKKDVTYLLAKMSVQDSDNFISDTLKTTRPQGMLREVENPECQKNPDCPRIGSVVTPADVPDEIE